MRKITMLWCRQGAGKTELMRGLALVLAMWLPVFANIPGYCDLVPGLLKWKYRGFSTIIVGPNQDRAKIAFNRIKAEVDSHKLDNLLNRTGNKIIASNSLEVRFTNGSYIINLTGSENTCKEGETADLIFFDESQDISGYSINSTYMPALSTTKGTAVFAGTSNNQDNDFYQKIQANLRNNKSNHSVMPEWIARVENPDYGEFVDKEILDLPGGKENPIYQMKYACKWELTGIGRIISWEAFDKQTGNHPLGIYDISTQRKYYIGSDWGKAQDYTVITVLEDHGDHYRLVDWLRIPLNIRYEEQYQIIQTWFANKPIKCLFGLSDSTGPGDAPTEALQRMLGLANVKPLVFSAHSKHAMYMSFEKALPRIFWPKCERNNPLWMNFSREMLDCELETVGNFYRWQAPDKKKEGLAQHDDFVASLFLAIFAAEGMPKARLI